MTEDKECWIVIQVAQSQEHAHAIRFVSQDNGLGSMSPISADGVYYSKEDATQVAYEMAEQRPDLDTVLVRVEQVISATDHDALNEYRQEKEQMEKEQLAREQEHKTYMAIVEEARARGLVFNNEQHLMFVRYKRPRCGGFNRDGEPCGHFVGRKTGDFEDFLERDRRVFCSVHQRMLDAEKPE